MLPLWAADLAGAAVGFGSHGGQAGLSGCCSCVGEALSGSGESVDEPEAEDVEVVVMAVDSVIRPRVFWVPECPDSLGDRAVAFSRRVGLTLDPEQELMLRSSVGMRADGKWQTREVGINVPRQNGKGEVLIARELFGLYELGEKLIIHTAHEFKTSAEHFNRLEAAIRDSPELLRRVHRRVSGQVDGFRYSHGEESVTLQDGSRIEFKTRTKSGMRGFAGVDLLVLDEAMIISEAAHSSAMPIIRASKAERGPQLWYTGSAVDQETHEHGVVWARVRERGTAGDDESLAYLEWSLDYEHPDDVPDEVVVDEVAWRSVNFAIERGRVTVEHMEWERRAMSYRGFVVELLGVGDWPSTDGSADVLLSVEDWAGLEDRESVLIDPVCIGFDVTPGGQTAIVAAGRNEQGLMHVEVVHANHGTGWVARALEALYRKHEVVELVCDGYGPSAAIARRVDDAGIKVRRLDTNEFVMACVSFVDAVEQKSFRHIGQDELAAAVRGAKARPLVDRWAWSRTKSTSDIGGLVAATLALWSATENDVGDVNIY